MNVYYQGEWTTLYKTGATTTKSEIPNAVEVRLPQHNFVVTFDRDFLKQVDAIHAAQGVIEVFTIDDHEYDAIHNDDNCEPMLQDFLLAMYDHDFIFGQRKQDLAALYYSADNKVMRVYLKSNLNNVYATQIPIACQSDYACRWFKKLYEQEYLLTDKPYFINTAVMRECNCKMEFVDGRLTIDGELFKTDSLAHTYSFVTDLVQILKRQ